MTFGADDPLSMFSQLTRQIMPSLTEIARERERQQERQRRRAAADKEKNKIRMKKERAKK